MLLRNTKRGSYLVEAAIVVPVFIIAVVMLISIIPIIGTIENINYAVVDEMHLEDIKSSYRENPLAYPSVIKHRVLEENEKVDTFKTDFYRYKFERNGVKDLISIEFHSVFSEKNPLGLFSEINYSGKVLSRAFTGSVHKVRNISPENSKENSKKVYIFPNWGERYHSKNCTYVKTSAEMVYLTPSLKKKRESCSLCKSKDAKVGSYVFVFPSSGSAYHFGNCKTVDKYYVEVDKEEAISKGYTPCLKCGGE